MLKVLKAGYNEAFGKSKTLDKMSWPAKGVKNMGTGKKKKKEETILDRIEKKLKERKNG